MPMKKKIICFEMLEEGQKFEIFFFSCFQVENKVTSMQKMSCLHPLMLLIRVSKFYPIMPPCLQVLTKFQSKYFSSVQVPREVLVVNELHYCDAPESNNTGVKRNCMPSSELQI